MPKDRKQTYSDRQSQASRVQKQQQEKNAPRKKSVPSAIPMKAGK